MVRSSARLCIVVALCSALGLHWILLQSVAWTSMVVKFSQGDSLRVAIEKTFDGKHPCDLCHAVQKGKSAEKKSTPALLAKKFDLIAEKLRAPVTRSFREIVYHDPSASAAMRSLSPPVPPPRLAVG